MANFTPYHTYLPKRSIVGIYSFCSLKHFGLLFPCFSHCKRSKIFLEALISLSIQHNLHSLELQRITLWYWDILAFPLHNFLFLYRVILSKHLLQVLLVPHSSISTTSQNRFNSFFNFSFSYLNKRFSLISSSLFIKVIQ